MGGFISITIEAPPNRADSYAFHAARMALACERERRMIEKSVDLMKLNRGSTENFQKYP